MALDNHNGKEVSFSASKFALRGIVHSLRETLREYSIGISILNLGTLATEYEIEDGAQIVLDEVKGSSIPVSDAIQVVKFIISTSNASCVKEINMPAMKDMNIINKTGYKNAYPFIAAMRSNDGYTWTLSFKIQNVNYEN